MPGTAPEGRDMNDADKLDTDRRAREADVPAARRRPSAEIGRAHV